MEGVQEKLAGKEILIVASILFPNPAKVGLTCQSTNGRDGDVAPTGVKFGGCKMKTSFGLIVLICAVLALGLLCSFDQLNAAGEEQEEEKICFRWAFGALIGKGDERKLVSITRDTPLKTGDQFKMLVELKRKCFVYVISKNSQGEVGLLFPRNPEQFAENYKTSKKYDIPPGDDNWLKLDENVGLESFYLLASVKRLIQLEELLDRYESAGAPERSELAERIVTEIRRIRKKHRRFTVAAERPVQIGGSVKKFDPNGKALPFDLSTIAVEVSAVDFFGKTFTIDHR